MKFNLPPDKRNISNEMLIQDIRNVCKKLSKSTITFEEYDQHGIMRAYNAARRFGSWNTFLKKAGLRINRRRDIKNEELFEEILRIWTAKGRYPVRDDLQKYKCKFGRTTYQRRFGSWRKALEAFVSYTEQNEDVSESKTNRTTRPPKRTPRFPNLRLRFKILVAANFKCAGCGKSPATDAGCELHIDHIIPYEKGGETIETNLQVLCNLCNYGKSNTF